MCFARRREREEEREERREREEREEERACSLAVETYVAVFALSF